jgi:outer membrane protein assembly factor BamD
MVRSYDRLGLEQLRDDADRVLHTNFPGSVFLSDSPAAKKKPWYQFW